MQQQPTEVRTDKAVFSSRHGRHCALDLRTL